MKKKPDRRRMYRRHFRGKSINNGEWLYGQLIDDDGNDPYIRGLGGLSHRVDPYTLGELVGWDADQTPIYEGDLLRYQDCADPDTLFLVQWYEPLHMFACTAKGRPILTEHMVIAGNIIDNPEMKEMIYEARRR